MSARAHGEFRSDLAEFRAVRGLAESFGAVAGLPVPAVQRLVLVLEELFTNTGSHGYGAASPGPVWVTLELGPDGIEVIYEDAARPFDPFGGGGRRPAGVPALDAPPGGVGLALVQGLALSARYERRLDRNRVTVILGAAPPAPPPGA